MKPGFAHGRFGDRWFRSVEPGSPLARRLASGTLSGRPIDLLPPFFCSCPVIEAGELSGPVWTRPCHFLESHCRLLCGPPRRWRNVCVFIPLVYSNGFLAITDSGSLSAA